MKKGTPFVVWVTPKKIISSAKKGQRKS